MKQNLRNSGNISDRILGRLAAEKKKTIIAVCLLAVTVFMWARVFGRRGPQSANAAVAVQKAAESQMNSKLKISFIELPKVEGRNDVLTRDFFTVGNWQDFTRGREGKSGSIEKVHIISRNGDVETARRAAEKLKLETIVLGENPRAFINDKLLSVGDKLFIGDGVNTCECEVTGIEEKTVFMRCGEQYIEDSGIKAED
jgi:hypothetical protein